MIIYKLFFPGGYLAFISRTFETGTLDEGIASHSGLASAHRYVIIYRTQCIPTARARAGINTLVADTCAIVSAIGVHDALGVATHVRITLVFGQAYANTIVASCVRSAWIRIA
jgi:hypothetical protein